MTYTIDQVAALTGAQCYGCGANPVSFLLTDSRSLCFPEETLFFAIRTKAGDGHAYIPGLYGRGVRSFMVEETPPGYPDSYPGAAFLRVPDTLKGLQRLAERHRERFGVPVVGITGSNGKTMAKEWLAALLAPDMAVARSPRSYNSQTGVPLSVWLMDGEAGVGIFEAGISKPGEMAPLRDIIQPTIAVLTNIGPAHGENFGSDDEKCMEKMELFRGAEAVAYDADDPVAERGAAASAGGARRICWSAKDKGAHLYIEKVEKTAAGATVAYSHAGAAGAYTIPFSDDASIGTSMACAAVALHMGLGGEELDRRMRALGPVAMRLEVKEGLNGATIINDSYNSDIHSLGIALDFMARRADPAGSSRTLVISDILESGQDSASLYGEVLRLARARGVGRIIGIGLEISAALGGTAEPECSFYGSADEFMASPEFAAIGGVVLVKGARLFGFDRISDRLARKVHETTLEVDLGAIVKNLNHYRSFMAPGTKTACMIKADAYGAGAEEVAKTLQDHRVDYLAVAVADEGAALRRAGVTAGIMVMNPEMSAFKTMFDNDLEPEVYSFRMLSALVEAARREGIAGWPVHIKMDTGMHRLGFDPEKDTEALVAALKAQGEVMPRSVFSHFVGADTPGMDGFTRRQYALFSAAADKLQAAFGHKILRHICNSAATERFPEYHMDMCRIGIGLYGVDPMDNGTINNVGTLKTTILQIRDAKAGESVGYGRKTVLERDSRIAAIPIGYADGLDRGLGNRRGYCLVAGEKAPYVGNICMDVAMADVTGIDCAEGDSVEIFGPGLPVAQLAEAIGTIPYEILTGVSSRVKRIYYKNN